MRRKDVPLFDCIFCVENAGLVMKGIPKKAIVNKYMDLFREISGTEQIPITFSKNETATKYDPDRV